MKSNGIPHPVNFYAADQSHERFERGKYFDKEK
jgi:hypothetical protein